MFGVSVSSACPKHQRLALSGLLFWLLLAGAALAEEAAVGGQDVARQLYGTDSLDRSYRRLLPLEGGSNFRDMGAYPTQDGRWVRRGQLFRSAAPTSLTTADIEYLSRFNIKTVMDLRSNEERALFPNRWVETDPSIDYRYVDYSMMDMLARFQGEQRERPGMGELYRYLPAQITAQLKLYFSALLQSRTPIVVNCSAGQDRTGLSAALLLSALGVSRELVIEDYLLSTDFRRPDREKGDVDLEAAAASNAFARMMLSYHQPGSIERANPLVTEQGVPFIVFALDQIETDYGSVEGYLEQALGVSADDLGSLRSLYLVDHPH